MCSAYVAVCVRGRRSVVAQVEGPLLCSPPTENEREGVDGRFSRIVVRGGGSCVPERHTFPRAEIRAITMAILAAGDGPVQMISGNTHVVARLRERKSLWSSRVDFRHAF